MTYNPKYFKYSEFDTGKIVGGKESLSGIKNMDEMTVRAIDQLRSICNFPFVINSAYRSTEYNEHIGGSKNSMHVKGKAFDVNVTCREKLARILSYARVCGFRGIGVYYNRKTKEPVFVHLDTRSKDAMWFDYI